MTTPGSGRATAGVLETPEPQAGYRPCVGVALFNPRGAVFVGQRRDKAEPAWQMPQGGIDEGETAVAAALRELEEETGTDKAEIVAETAGWLHYDLPPDVARVRWKGRYRGQAQKWFACRFLGVDGNIDLETEHPEFSAWKWVAPGELPRLIVPFKRPVYEAVLRELAPAIGAATEMTD